MLCATFGIDTRYARDDAPCDQQRNRGSTPVKANGYTNSSRASPSALIFVAQLLCNELHELLVPECHHRIDAYGAACGNITGKQCDQRQQNCTRDECPWIVRGDPKELVSDETY